MQIKGFDWRYWQVRRTTIIALLAAGVLAGIWVAQFNAPSAMWLLACICVAIFGLRGKKWYLAVPCALVIGLCVGLLRGSDTRQYLATYGPLLGSKVQLTGTLTEDTVYGDRGQRDMRLTNVQLHGHELPGVVRVTALTIEQPRRGDTVQVSGKLYSGFGSYQAAIYFGQLHITHVNQDPLETLRRYFAASVYSLLPDTQAGLGLGMLIGLKTQMSDSLSDQLKVLALTHIVVASGYNLTILLRLARRLFERFSKFQTVAIGFTLMGLFVVVAGFGASMSRAALVTGLCLLAWYYGRRTHPVVLLLFAAAVTAVWNPLYMWSDLGWWLSFLAFAGVMLLAPLIERRIFGEKRPKLLGQLAIETCAAQIATLPLILAIFGSLSVLGFFANIILVPLVPFAMLFTFVAGVVGLMFGAAAGYVALPALWLLTFMTQVVHMLASVPWAAVQCVISQPVMVGLYVLSLAGGVLLWRRTRYDFLGRSVIE
ncbi:MAG TPA: ComEC/Rec2 family competence protein [Candidatus Saccharimonadales bacterium]|nr:ComEC/Rec2 family competence protein [Candidatus Saccharimonadales bacterium]